MRNANECVMLEGTQDMSILWPFLGFKIQSRSLDSYYTDMHASFGVVWSWKSCSVPLCSPLRLQVQGAGAGAGTVAATLS